MVGEWDGSLLDYGLNVLKGVFPVVFSLEKHDLAGSWPAETNH
jgi:hypothetical protein